MDITISKDELEIYFFVILCISSYNKTGVWICVLSFTLHVLRILQYFVYYKLCNGKNSSAI